MMKWLETIRQKERVGREDWERKTHLVARLSTLAGSSSAGVAIVNTRFVLLFAAVCECLLLIFGF
jgi:hypothetical protein